jgi:hypothetical protein
VRLLSKRSAFIDRNPGRTGFVGLRCLLCAVVLVLHPSVGAAKTAHVPDWMKAASTTAMPPLRPHDSAAVLLDQTEITVDGRGRATVHSREVVKILTAAGRSYAEYPQSYDTGGKLHYLHSWTIGADGHEYQEDDKGMADVSAVPDSDVYASGRIRMAQALAAEPGAIVGFESEVEEAPITTSWEFDLDAMIPSAGQSVTLTLPAGTDYTAWAHMAPIKPASLSATSWQWTLGPRKSLDDEDAAPPSGDVASRMLLAYSGPGASPVDGSWSTVGTWYQGLIKDREPSSPAIDSQVTALIAGKPDFVGKLLAISGFLQDQVRYVAVEMGIGGWQPHAAADVFRNRFGDCKDKATLLITMLDDAGIKSYPLVVDFSHRVDQNVPTHYADHMITAIEVPAGVNNPLLQALVEWHGKRLLIFDPTNSFSPAGSLESDLQGSWGILLDGAQTEVIHLPVIAARDNVLVRTGSFSLATDGSLSGTVAEVRRGNAADPWRDMFLHGDKRRLEQIENASLHGALADFTMTDLSAEHTRDRSLPFDVTYKLAVDHYIQHAGNMLLVRPSVVGMYQSQNLENGRPRLYPIALGAEEDLKEDDTITLPSGYKADDLPDPVHIEVPFATFDSAVTMNGNTLHYTRELAIHSMELPAADQSQYQAFFGKVGNAEREEALLKPAP